jgi:hypothetical protein
MTANVSITNISYPLQVFNFQSTIFVGCSNKSHYHIFLTISVVYEMATNFIETDSFLSAWFHQFDSYEDSIMSVHSACDVRTCVEMAAHRGRAYKYLLIECWKYTYVHEIVVADSVFE